jgi:hypothetical protein
MFSMTSEFCVLCTLLLRSAAATENLTRQFSSFLVEKLVAAIRAESLIFCAEVPGSGNKLAFALRIVVRKFSSRFCSSDILHTPQSLESNGANKSVLP